MKIAIVGSSHLTKEDEIKTRKYCEEIFTKKREVDKKLILISGGANGVDSIAEDVAGDYAIKTEIYKCLFVLQNNKKGSFPLVLSHFRGPTTTRPFVSR